MKYLSLFLLLCVVSCKLIDTNNCYREYLFEIPFTTSPTQDTLHIGDTLWINSYFSNRLVDLNTNDTLLVDNIDFNTDWGIARIDMPHYKHADDYFQYVPSEGDISNNFFGLALHYDYYDNYYHFKLGIIPDSVGNYRMHFITLTIDNEINLDNDCDDEFFFVHYKMNELTGNNYHLLEQSPDTSISTSSYEEFIIYGGYAFVVTE
jgi:hypothetical protein